MVFRDWGWVGVSGWLQRGSMKERNALYDTVMVEPVIIHLPKSIELQIYRTVQNEFYNMQILKIN